MMGLLQNVNQSMEAQDIAIKSQANDIKAYEAETRRIQAMSAAMSPEQVQEVVIQTLRDVMDLGNLAPMPQNFMPEQPMMMPPEQGMPQ
jgi:type II secretory pathway component PulM